MSDRESAPAAIREMVDRETDAWNRRHANALVDLVHNRRWIESVLVTAEGDGGMAVVDVDTLWRHHDGTDFHWLGRASKGYARVGDRWLMVFQTGLLRYPGPADSE